MTLASSLRRLFGFVFAGLIALTPAQAGMIINPYAFTSAPAGTLLLDVYPGAIAAYGMRKLRSAYAGSALRLIRASDSAEQDIGFSGDDFDASAAATFCNATSCKVTTWYDQTVNGYNLLQATGNNQPPYQASLINSLPAISIGHDASVPNPQFMAISGQNITYSGAALSVFAIFRTSNWDTSNSRICSFRHDASSADWNTNNSFNINWHSSGPHIRAENNGAKGQSAGAKNTNYMLASIFDGANNTLYLNGTGSTPVSSTQTLGDGSSRLYLGASDAAGGDYQRGAIGELILWGNDQTSNRASIEADMEAAWGL